MKCGVNRGAFIKGEHSKCELFWATPPDSHEADQPRPPSTTRRLAKHQIRKTKWPPRPFAYNSFKTRPRIILHSTSCRAHTSLSDAKVSATHSPWLKNKWWVENGTISLFSGSFFADKQSWFLCYQVTLGQSQRRLVRFVLVTSLPDGVNILFRKFPWRI